MTSYDCTLDALTSYHLALVRYRHELLQQNQYLLQQLHHAFARGELRRGRGGAAQMRAARWRRRRRGGDIPLLCQEPGDMHVVCSLSQLYTRLVVFCE